MHEKSDGTLLRRCFRDPIPEVFEAARLLDAAVTLHVRGQESIAAELFREADDPRVRDWLESIWGKKSLYVNVTKIPFVQPPSVLPVRIPTTEQKRQLHERDGYCCRFCGLPVIRAEIRKRIMKSYPAVVRWGNSNITQHAAFQALWAQYDHIVPHARGGANDLENIVVACAACNFGRMSYALEEVGLEDPRQRAPEKNWWDGLERFK